MDARLKKLITSKLLHFTEHAKFKMRQYGLSEARVKRVLRAPSRLEAGIAPKTVAVMQPASGSAAHASAESTPHRTGSGAGLRFSGTSKPAGRPAKRAHEIWVMYQDTKKARRIIAAWRYPGVSPVREPPPFPEDLMK